MRDYGVVSPNFWIKGTGKDLRGDPPAQVVALYLMTSPHSSMIGVFYLPKLYISEETGCSLQATSKALRRLISVGFCDYDDPTQTIFVVRMAAFQVAESLQPGDKRVIGLKKDVERILSPRLRQRFLEVYGRLFHLVPADWKPEGAYQAPQGASQAPSYAPSIPLRSQDQDQDQDQEQQKALGLETVPGLDAKAWSEWFEYRKESGKPIKGEKSIAKAQLAMAKLGPRQQEAVDHSMSNGYQGLFLPKPLNGGRAIPEEPAKPASPTGFDSPGNWR
jgi:hypothetical protein